MSFNKIQFIHDIEKCNLKTPQFFKKDQEYFDTLKKSLNMYKDLCKKCDAPGNQIIAKCCDALIESVRFYLKGNLISAQNCINDALSSFVLKNYIVTTTIDNCIGFIPIKSAINNEKVNNPILFRARINDKNISFSQKDMLHIPFSERYKVNSERFSQPGLPCLYLGSTSYVCWLELNKPSDNSFNVSAFKFNKDLKIFALTVDYEALCIWLNNYFEEQYIEKLECLLCILPFTYASSFSFNDTFSNNRNFHIEYIIPQMIMNFAISKKYDGIAYLSNKVKSHTYDAYGTGVNFAIWAKYKSKSKEYSTICNNLELTQPVNFSEFKNLSIENTPDQNEIQYSEINYAGNRYKYENTIFYQFDNYLKSLNKTSVDIDKTK